MRQPFLRTLFKDWVSYRQPFSSIYRVKKCFLKIKPVFGFKVGQYPEWLNFSFKLNLSSWNFSFRLQKLQFAVVAPLEGRIYAQLLMSRILFSAGRNLKHWEQVTIFRTRLSTARPICGTTGRLTPEKRERLWSNASRFLNFQNIIGDTWFWTICLVFNHCIECRSVLYLLCEFT